MRRIMSRTLAALRQADSPALDGVFTVAEPFFDDLVASHGVIPHFGRDVSPIRMVVQVDIKGGHANMKQRIVKSQSKCLRHSGEWIRLRLECNRARRVRPLPGMVTPPLPRWPQPAVSASSSR